MTFPFCSVLFCLNGNEYHFRAVENGERRSMKQELNGNITEWPYTYTSIGGARPCRTDS